MLMLMMRTLYMGGRGVGVSSVASRDAESGAVGAGEVEGMVSGFAAVDALHGAVADAVFFMLACSAAVGGVVVSGVSAGTEVAVDCVSFELTAWVACRVAESVAAGTLAEGWAGFEATGEGAGSEGSDGGLENLFGEGSVGVVNREGEGSIFFGDVVWTKQPSWWHDELDAFQDWVEAEGGFEVSF